MVSSQTSASESVFGLGKAFYFGHFETLASNGCEQGGGESAKDQSSGGFRGELANPDWL